MPFQTARELTDFADTLGRWHPPPGMTFAVAIAVLPPGPRASSVVATVEYYGRGGTIVFRKPERAKVAFRMLRDAAALVIGACAERN